MLNDNIFFYFFCIVLKIYCGFKFNILVKIFFNCVEMGLKFLLFKNIINKFD